MGKGNPYLLLVAMPSGSNAMINNMDTSQKMKSGVSYKSVIIFLAFTL